MRGKEVEKGKARTRCGKRKSWKYEQPIGDLLRESRKFKIENTIRIVSTTEVS